MYAVYEKLSTDGSYWLLATFAFLFHAEAYVEQQKKICEGLDEAQRPTYKVVREHGRAEGSVNLDADPSLDEVVEVV